MEFCILTEEEFKKFSSVHPQESFFQTVETGNLRKSYGSIIHYLGIKKNNEIIAGGMFSETPCMFGKKRLYAPQGFLIDYDNYEVLEFFTKELLKYGKKIKQCINIMFSLIIILIVVFLFKRFVHDLVDYLQNDKGKIILYGLLGLVCIPIISLIFLITVIGLPICILLMSAYIFAITIANAIVGLAIGSYICSKTNKEKNDPTLMKIILISLLVVLGILLISNIPYIGALVSFVKIVLCFGLLLQPLLKKKNK